MAVRPAATAAGARGSRSPRLSSRNPVVPPGVGELPPPRSPRMRTMSTISDWEKRRAEDPIAACASQYSAETGAAITRLARALPEAQAEELLRLVTAIDTEADSNGCDGLN